MLQLPAGARIICVLHGHLGNPPDRAVRSGVKVMRTRDVFLFLLLVGVAGAQLRGQGQQTDWNKPFPAHKVIGNVYFVVRAAGVLPGHYSGRSHPGQQQLRNDSAGDSGRGREAWIHVHRHQNPGRQPRHGDHMEGDALVKELTKAQVMAMEQDVPALRNMRPGGKEHPIDRVLRDGDEVTLGGTTMVARLTAGHTKGCTTWTLKAQEGGRATASRSPAASASTRDTSSSATRTIRRSPTTTPGASRHYARFLSTSFLRRTARNTD